MTAAKARTEEGSIKSEIMDYLEALPGCYVRLILVAGKRGRTSPTKGVSDIIGVYRGRFLGIEVKTDSGVVSPEQRKFLDAVNACGGIGIVARSLGDVVNAISTLS